MKITIHNGATIVNMKFQEKDIFEAAIKKIKNCIDHPDKYQSVNYHEKGQLMGIYPAEMLRRSIIQIEP